MLKNCGDVAVRDMVRGYGEDGQLDLVILELFSNLNDPMIIRVLVYGRFCEDA